MKAPIFVLALAMPTGSPSCGGSTCGGTGEPCCETSQCDSPNYCTTNGYCVDCGGNVHDPYPEAPCFGPAPTYTPYCNAGYQLEVSKFVAICAAQ
jgi:hypothetical protein